MIIKEKLVLQVCTFIDCLNQIARCLKSKNKKSYIMNIVRNLVLNIKTFQAKYSKNWKIYFGVKKIEYIYNYVYNYPKGMDCSIQMVGWIVIDNSKSK